jgi:hypothetical protein
MEYSCGSPMFRGGMMGCFVVVVVVVVVVVEAA